jgi:hypothetical protein
MARASKILVTVKTIGIILALIQNNLHDDPVNHRVAVSTFSSR